MLLSNTGTINNAYNEGYSGFMYRRFASTFGRLNYEYKDRYFLTATIRRDGSSRFGSAEKFGVFPVFRQVGKFIMKNSLKIFKNPVA